MSFTFFLVYALVGLAGATALWLLYRYGQERRYRRQPYVSSTARAGAAAPTPSKTPAYSIALVGDLGAVATNGRDPVINLLQDWQQQTGEAGAVVILGDNIYPTGLPAPTHPGRADAEHRLNAQLDALRPFAGRVIFLSGNHDWNKGRRDGYEYLLRQEAYVRDHLPTAHYLPARGCPGPATLQLPGNVLLVVLNTQWWVQHGTRPLGEAYGCTATTSREPFEQLRQVLAANQHQRIVVAGHHPLYSNAMHGGQFTTKQHVFPLLAVHKKAYLPLPVVGSLFPAYRRVVGAAEDMAHPRYRAMRRRLLRVLRDFPNIIYAAGHDHNLQYFQRRGGHYLVSGSGSKTAFVQKGGKATFTHEHKGFFVIEFYANGEAWLRTLEPGNQTGAVRATEPFRSRLYTAAAPSEAVAPTPAAASARAGSAG
ncbi:metallophosphoesterase [Hymenobacter sp. NBH84]|uniref:metallophosphoesterase family protein n=1 Tax=Hymenobacter sp. NBH84 TaxID=2596915 RepID=UPI001629B8FD|nr:metallophosphoesterase [Hymenobacter sp. NBH84]QNE39300.1 metallophosphoesterase [Hymenobacter sp. NBH84]